MSPDTATCPLGGKVTEDENHSPKYGGGGRDCGIWAGEAETLPCCFPITAAESYVILGKARRPLGLSFLIRKVRWLVAVGGP